MKKIMVNTSKYWYHLTLLADPGMINLYLLCEYYFVKHTGESRSFSSASLLFKKLSILVHWVISDIFDNNMLSILGIGGLLFVNLYIEILIKEPGQVTASIHLNTKWPECLCNAHVARILSVRLQDSIITSCIKKLLILVPWPWRRPVVY